MSEWSTEDPAFEIRVRSSFENQNIMKLLGAELDAVAPGHCRIRLPFRTEFGQQNGFFHAGITSTIADSAGGYAGFTLMPAGSDVLTIEFKINLLRPASGSQLVADGQVIRAGRNLTFTEVSVSIEDGSDARICARMSQTLMCMQPETGS